MHMLHSICGFPAHAGVLHHLQEDGVGTLLLFTRYISEPCAVERLLKSSSVPKAAVSYGSKQRR